MIELENHDPENGIIKDCDDEKTDTKVRDFFYQGLTSEDVPPIVVAQNPVFQYLVEVGMYVTQSISQIAIMYLYFFDNN